MDRLFGYFSGAGENLPQYAKYQSLHVKLPAELQLQATIAITGFSSAISQAAANNASQSQNQLSKGIQALNAYTPFMAKYPNNSAVIEMRNTLVDARLHTDRVLKQYQAMDSDKRAQFAQGQQAAVQSHQTYRAQSDVRRDPTQDLEAGLRKAASSEGLTTAQNFYAALPGRLIGSVRQAVTGEIDAYVDRKSKELRQQGVGDAKKIIIYAVIAALGALIIGLAIIRR